MYVVKPKWQRQTDQRTFFLLLKQFLPPQDIFWPLLSCRLRRRVDYMVAQSDSARNCLKLWCPHVYMNVHFVRDIRKKLKCGSGLACVVGRGALRVANPKYPHSYPK